MCLDQNTSPPGYQHQHPKEEMTLSPSAALSILLPINLELPRTSSPSPSLDSVSIQSDDENDREVVEKRLSRYYPETPTTIGAVVRPQFSCPDFGLGTARGFMARIKEAPPVPPVPKVPLAADDAEDRNVVDETGGSPLPRRVRKQNSFARLDGSIKRRREDIFQEESPIKRKRHGLFLGRLQPEPHNAYRRSKFLTSFDEIFNPDIPTSKRYPFKEEGDDDSLRERIKQGMEDSIIPSVQATPIKSEKIPLRERIRNLMNAERPKKARRKGWLDRIVGKRRNRGQKENIR